MLVELSIRNFALIEEATLELGPGLNVLTGETGAGKSIVVDAMGLLLGGRAPVDAIRSGCDEASIDGVFSLAGEGTAALRQRLAETGTDVGEDRLVVLTREMSRSGRNRCRINGRTTTLSHYASIGEDFVDIYGQHEHQSLTRVERHVDLLDAFSGPEAASLRARVSELHERACDIRRRLADNRSLERQRTQRLDLLRFQVKEIEQARLAAGEEEELAAERAVLANAERLTAMLQEAYELLFGPEAGGPGALDSASRAASRLEAAVAVMPALCQPAEMVRSAAVQIQEAAREVRALRDSVRVDPERLAAVGDRLEFISRLKKKYGDSLREVLDYLEQARREIRDLESNEVDASRLAIELEATRASLAEVAAALSDVRHQAASELESRLAVELADLGMTAARFLAGISSEPEDIRSDGMDRVEFLFSANPGEDPKPLARIASGGELSRIMLAIKATLAAADDVPTLIFDEIDSGIGGRTAPVVAEKLAGIGRARQVICVTHLAPIASRAGIHFRIAKEVDGGRTKTVVSRLSGEDRVNEVARMLGGRVDSEVATRHAREMLGGMSPQVRE